MKRVSILLLLPILATIASLAQEVYHNNLYYYQRTSLFEKLPIDSDDIIFLGNSITDNCEWHELFGNPNIKNRGIGSDVSMGVYERLAPIVEGKPAKIFLMIGINDVSHDLSTDSIVGNIARIVRKIRHDSPATQLYIQSMLPINNSFGQYRKLAGKEPQIVEINQRLEQLAAAEQCTYIDLYSHLTAPGSNDLDPAYTNDGLHLLGDAYLVWKEVLQPYLK